MDHKTKIEPWVAWILTNFFFEIFTRSCRTWVREGTKMDEMKTVSASHCILSRPIASYRVPLLPINSHLHSHQVSSISSIPSIPFNPNCKSKWCSNFLQWFYYDTNMLLWEFPTFWEEEVVDLTGSDWHIEAKRKKKIGAIVWHRAYKAWCKIINCIISSNTHRKLVSLQNAWIVSKISLCRLGATATNSSSKNGTMSSSKIAKWSSRTVVCFVWVVCWKNSRPVHRLSGRSMGTEKSLSKKTKEWSSWRTFAQNTNTQNRKTKFD